MRRDQAPGRRAHVLCFINDDGSEVGARTILLQESHGSPVAVRHFHDTVFSQLGAVLLEDRP